MSTTTAPNRRTITFNAIKPPDLPVPVDPSKPDGEKRYTMIAIAVNGGPQTFPCTPRIWRLTSRFDFHSQRSKDYDLTFEGDVVVDIQVRDKPATNMFQTADSEGEADLLTLQKSGSSYSPQHIPNGVPRAVVDEIVAALEKLNSTPQPGELVADKYELIEHRSGVGRNMILIRPTPAAV